MRNSPRPAVWRRDSPSCAHRPGAPRSREAALSSFRPPKATAARARGAPARDRSRSGSNCRGPRQEKIQARTVSASGAGPRDREARFDPLQTSRIANRFTARAGRERGRSQQLGRVWGSTAGRKWRRSARDLRLLRADQRLLREGRRGPCRYGKACWARPLRRGRRRVRRDEALLKEHCRPTTTCRVDVEGTWAHGDGKGRYAEGATFVRARRAYLRACQDRPLPATPPSGARAFDARRPRGRGGEIAFAADGIAKARGENDNETLRARACVARRRRMGRMEKACTGHRVAGLETQIEPKQMYRRGARAGDCVALAGQEDEPRMAATRLDALAASGGEPTACSRLRSDGALE